MKQPPATIPCPVGSRDPLANGWADPSIGLDSGIRHEITKPITRAARRLGEVLTEILVGARPSAQCSRWLRADEYAVLTQWLTAHPRIRVSSRRLRVCCPDPDHPIVIMHWCTSAGQVTATAQLVVASGSVNCRRVTVLVGTGGRVPGPRRRS